MLLCVLEFIFLDLKWEDKFGMKIKPTNAYKYLRVPYIALYTWHASFYFEPNSSVPS